MGRLLALVVAVLALVPAPAGAAEEEPPPVEVDLHTGFDGLFVPGRPVPVRIALEASALASGQLSLSMQMGPAEVIDFEVAGGGREEHWALLDAPMQDVANATAVVDMDGRRTEVASIAARWEQEAHLIGVLDGSAFAAQPPRDVRTAVLDQELTFAPLPAALLDLGPQALAALDGIAVSAADLDALAEEHRTAVLGWVSAGGTLYVDTPAGAVAGLPESMQPVNGSVTAGAGRVVATDGALAAGRWADVVVAAPNRSVHEDRDVSANLPRPDLPTEVFAVDLGRDLPPLGRLLAVIVVYALLVGPGAYLALRRRPTARWVAIPVLAGLATGVLYLSGDGVGAGTTVDVVDVIETGPSAVATSRLAMATEDGGREVVAPPGWVAEQDELVGFGMEHQVQQRRTVDGVEIALPVLPGGVGVVRASGPVELDGALEVDAAATADGVVRGTVRNTTSVTLEQVAVFAGRASSTGLGTLGPGQEAAFEVTGTNQFRFAVQPFRERWGSIAMGGMGPGMAVPDTTMAPMPMPPDMGPIVSEECDELGCRQCDADGTCVEMGRAPAPMLNCDDAGNCFPAGGCGEPGFCGAVTRPETLGAALWERGSNAMADGMVTAVGWTTDLDPVVDLGDSVEVAGIHTALVGRAVPTVDAEHLVDSAPVRTLVRAGQNANGMVELVNRYEVPSAVGGRPVDLSRLRLDIPQMFTEVAILTPSGEHVVRSGDAPADQRQEVAVPADAVVRGHVFVRTALPFAPPPPGRELVLYEAVT